MATFTKLYLPSSGAPDVTPSTWNHTNQVASPVTLKGAITKGGTAFVDGGEGTGTTSPFVKAMGRWVIGPLAAQSISGTVNAVLMCDESNAGATATMSIAVKIVQPNGADRAVLLANTASTTANGVHEFGTSFATRRAYNSSNTRPIPLTTQSASAGDYLVVELGWRSATTTNRTIAMRYGDEDTVNDLVDADANTNNYSPWVAFSNAITVNTSDPLPADDVTQPIAADGSALVGALAGDAVSQPMTADSPALVGSLPGDAADIPIAMDTGELGPGAPAKVTATVSDDPPQLNIQWADVDGETSYEVFYSISPNLDETTYDGVNPYP